MEGSGRDKIQRRSDTGQGKTLYTRGEGTQVETIRAGSKASETRGDSYYKIKADVTKKTGLKGAKLT